jgi:hypothetical protein
MINTPIQRNAGQTYTLDLTTSASSALLVTPTVNDNVNYVSLLNTGSGVAGVEFAPTSASLITPTIATTGNSGSFVLPGGMNFPLIIAVPKGPFYMKAISSSTNTLYVTPVTAD